MTENDTLKKSPEERIGTSSHSTRNLALTVGLLGAVGFITLFYWRTGKSDEVAIEEAEAAEVLPGYLVVSQFYLKGQS